jgi:Na+-transporting NADH:ubiquinone oxidoreductase subunit F
LIYLVSITVFLGVTLVLVGLLLAVEARLSAKGTSRVVINGDEAAGLSVPTGKTLLAGLLDNKILIPCACGGKGTCGTCKCQVLSGGGQALPTELSLVSRRERLSGIRLACQLKVRQDIAIRLPEEIFNVKRYTASVVSNDNVATFIKELVLQLDPGQSIDFQAGAYIQIDIPEYKAAFADFNIGQRFLTAWKKFNLLGLAAASDTPVNRAYSLANPPSEKGILRFTIRIATPPPGQSDIPPGIGSSFLFNLKPGDRVGLSGPYGDFFVKPTENEMCFIGGGAGMAPLRSQILNQLVDRNTRRRISFWYGARSAQEMFYHDEFTDLAARYPHFTYHVALSDPQPEDNWTGLTGFIHQAVHDHYLKDHPDPAQIEYYLCGPPMMIAAVKRMLDGLGVEPEMIAFDNFG